MRTISTGLGRDCCVRAHPCRLEAVSVSALGAAFSCWRKSHAPFDYAPRPHGRRSASRRLYLCASAGGTRPAGQKGHNVCRRQEGEVEGMLGGSRQERSARQGAQDLPQQVQARRELTRRPSRGIPHPGEPSVRTESNCGRGGALRWNYAANCAVKALSCAAAARLQIGELGRARRKRRSGTEWNACPYCQHRAKFARSFLLVWQPAWCFQPRSQRRAMPTFPPPDSLPDGSAITCPNSAWRSISRPKSFRWIQPKRGKTASFISLRTGAPRSACS